MSLHVFRKKDQFLNCWHNFTPLRWCHHALEAIYMIVWISEKWQVGGLEAPLATTFESLPGCHLTIRLKPWHHDAFKSPLAQKTAHKNCILVTGHDFVTKSFKSRWFTLKRWFNPSQLDLELRINSKILQGKYQENHFNSTSVVKYLLWVKTARGDHNLQGTKCFDQKWNNINWTTIQSSPV